MMKGQTCEGKKKKIRKDEEEIWIEEQMDFFRN